MAAKNPDLIVDYIHCESTENTIEIHRGRNGYNWTGQKGKNLEWTIPVLVEKSADEILNKIYNDPEWQKYGKGKETSIDSPALRDVIWNHILPNIDIKSMKLVSPAGTNREAMKRTQTKGKYVIETKKDIQTIGSNECYTFYQSVEFVIDWFLQNVSPLYFKDKIVYLNAGDARSAFWIYFCNNFKQLGLKELAATHYDGTGLSYGNKMSNLNRLTFWEEYSGYILRYNGKTIRRIPPVGVQSKFHGDFREPVCMKIAKEEADIIITNPPFGEQWEQYVKAMLSTEKKLIFWGNGTAPLYNWFMRLLDEHKVYIVKDCSHTQLTDFYMTPNFWKKQALGFIYTTEEVSWQKPERSYYSGKEKMLSEGTAWYDDNSILCCDKALIPADTDETLAVSVNIIKHGILNAGYKIGDYHRYSPLKAGKKGFARILIKKDQKAKKLSRIHTYDALETQKSAPPASKSDWRQKDK